MPSALAAGGPVLSGSEALASQLVHDQDFSQAPCLRLFSSVAFKKGSIQRAVVKGDESKSEYILLGVFGHGGIQGIMRKRDGHRILTKHLCKLMKHRGVKEPSSSICVNHGSSAKVHKDVHNKCDTANHTILPGDFVGGRLWIHDEKPDGEAQGVVKRQLPDGTHACGTICSKRSTVVTFDPKSCHRVEPWKGDNWSIPAYVNRVFFVPNMPSAPAPSSKPDPDDDHTLFEFYESDKTT